MRTREEINAYHREWSRKNRDRVREYVANSTEVRFANTLRLRYHLTVEQFDKMVQEQQRLCAVCRGEHVGRGHRLYVDHDHETGKVRGLLCCRCNFLIGHAKDSIEILRAAISYLERQRT